MTSSFWTKNKYLEIHPCHGYRANIYLSPKTEYRTTPVLLGFPGVPRFNSGFQRARCPALEMCGGRVWSPKGHEISRERSLNRHLLGRLDETTICLLCFGASWMVSLFSEQCVTCKSSNHSTPSSTKWVKRFCISPDSPSHFASHPTDRGKRIRPRIFKEGIPSSNDRNLTSPLPKLVQICPNSLETSAGFLANSTTRKMCECNWISP